MIPAPIPVDDEQRCRALEALQTLDTPSEERFDRVTRLCLRLFDVPMAFVNVIDRDRQYMKSAQGLPRVELARSGSFCGHAILDAAGLVVPDTAQDSRFADNPLVTGDPHLRFYAGAPLQAPGGHRVGTLCIADTTPRVLSAADRTALADLASVVQQELTGEQELRKAARVQQALLPVRPLRAPGWEIVGACRLSSQVGGDFYDWYSSAHGPVVAIGDVMGKGMAAAIMMASVRAALRTGTRMESLADGLEDAARSLVDDFTATGTFATAAIVRLSPDGNVTMVDAGHGHAAVVRADGNIELLTDGGLPLGISTDEQYAMQRLNLAHDDLLILHSDGLLELPGGPQSTAEVAALATGSASACETVARLLTISATATPSDDVTVVTVRRSA